MKNILAVSFLGLLATSAVAQEDFLGEETEEETEIIQPEPAIPFADGAIEWRDGRWGIDSNYSMCTTMLYDNSNDDGLRNFNLYLHPENSKDNAMSIGHLTYAESKPDQIVRGSIKFDQDEPKKFKFKIDGPMPGYVGYLSTNINLNFVRSLLKAKTMSVTVEGAKTVTISLNDIDKLTTALEYCYEKIKKEKENEQ